MGMATYYMKAYDCTPESFELIKQFFSQGWQAEDWWQKNRGCETKGHREEFWETFDLRFPLITKYLKFIKLHGGDCNNDLAGYLDFGNWEEEHENMILIDGDEFRYNAYVWHFADWDGLSKYLSKEYGITNVRWLSDEYTEDIYNAM